MSTDNVGLVRRGYEAYGRGDFPAIFALLHPDIEIVQTEQLPWGGTYRGHEQARDFFRKLTTHIESQVEPQEFVEAGDQVVAVGRIRGHVRANGQPFDLRIVHVWTIRGEQAVRFEAYIETPQMLRTLTGPLDTATT